MGSDLELARAWQEGDADAAHRLFDRYFDALYRFFATKVGQGIEDLIQETLLACVEGVDGLRRPEAFRTFLFGVARRRLYRRFRDQKRGANAIDFDLASVTDLGPSPSGLAAARERQRILLQAMQRIPVHLQIALELHYWEDMSAAEIAAVLEIPEGTVRSRLRRARALVQEALAQLRALPITADDFAELSRSLERQQLPRSGG